MGKGLPKRKWTRLPNFDYSEQRAYFITICTQDRNPILSRIVGRGLDPSAQQAEIELTPFGMIAKSELLSIPNHFPEIQILNYVIMLDHMHILLLLGCKGERAEGSRPLPTIATVIGQYKSGVSRKCKRSLWQKYYHDHIVRNQYDFEALWQYIDNNPLQWVLDGKTNLGIDQ